MACEPDRFAGDAFVVGEALLARRRWRRRGGVCGSRAWSGAPVLGWRQGITRRRAVRGESAVIEARGAGPDVPDGGRAGPCAEGREPDHREGRVRQLHRAVGLRQDHVPARIAALETAHGGDADGQRDDARTRRGGRGPMAMCSRRRGCIRGGRLRGISGCRWRSWGFPRRSRTSGFDECWRWWSSTGSGEVSLAAFGRDAAAGEHRAGAGV